MLVRGTDAFSTVNGYSVTDMSGVVPWLHTAQLRSLSVWLRKQTEARHAKALEAAEEKFRKALDRVKRAAIEAPRSQGNI